MFIKITFLTEVGGKLIERSHVKFTKWIGVSKTRGTFLINAGFLNFPFSSEEKLYCM